MIEPTINDAQTIAGSGGAMLAGRYRIVRQLGQGGMGSVWLAENTLLDNKPFAIKMLPTILVSNKRAYRQLKDAALVAMKLTHPNIVTFRAFEENNGNPFLVMDYIDGQTHDDYLAETGYRHESNERLRVFLTNSLEEHDKEIGTLFAAAVSKEANEANYIKRDCPVMVVIGNPPYSVSSSNKGEWIENLVSSYKKNLNEREINLDDDYIKFIRLGQHYIDRNGEGILAYISNNSFLNGITHRQMRKPLM